MVGDLAAPVGLHHRAAQRFDVDQQMLAPAPAAQGHHMGMLQQEKMVVGGVAVKAALECQGIVVGHTAEPADPQHGPVSGHQRRAQRISASQSRVSMISLVRWRNAAA